MVVFLEVMIINKREGLVFLFLLLFMLTLGIYSQWPTTLTPDAAMHAEIVHLIGQQGFLRTWEPYAPVAFTYPPLFHYLAFLLPLEPIDAVRVLGLVIWLFFPLAAYLLVGSYDKKAAVFGAVIVGFMPLLSTIFVYGEFPQLLGMLFFVFEWYFLRKNAYKWGALFTGLVVLSHAFVGLVAVFLFFYACCLEKRKIKKEITAVVVLVFVSSLWGYGYINIVLNALSGKWNNIVYNATQPVFGFWPVERIVDFLFGIHGFTVILFILALFGFFCVRDGWLRAFFVVGVALSVFHLPLTQLKVYDMTGIVVLVLAALGMEKMIRGLNKRWRMVGVALVLVVLGVVQVVHIQRGLENWFNPEIAPTSELAEAARWLAEHDPQMVRVYAHRASAWVGVLAQKLPLNPDVSYIEVFTPHYKEQLAAQEEVGKWLERGWNASEMLRRWDVEYIIVPSEIGVGLPLVYGKGGLNVYSVNG